MRAEEDDPGAPEFDAFETESDGEDIAGENAPASGAVGQDADAGENEDPLDIP